MITDTRGGVLYEATRVSKCYILYQNVTYYICQNVLIFMQFFSEAVFYHYHITVAPRSDTTLL